MSLSGGELEYSLTSAFSTIDSVYSGLGAGTFMLYARTEHGCTYSYPFTIENVEQPDFNLSSMGTCQDLNLVSLEIDLISDDNVLFSLHPDVAY